MNKRQKRLRIIITTPVIILWVISNLYYYWIKVGGGIFLYTGLLQLACFLIIVVSIIILVIKMTQQSEWRNLKNYLSIGFAILVFISLNIPVFRVNENTFQSNVEIRACYEGTMNTSRLYFRENGTFEDFNIGWFAFVHYYKGTWKQDGDTLSINYEGERPLMSYDKLVIRDKNLYHIQEDTLAPSFFYLGNCKGLN